MIRNPAKGNRRLQRVPRFGDNPGELSMLTYMPAGLEAGAALVVVLHGCTQTAESYADNAGWLDLADRFKFGVLCPEQTRSNNPNLCFNWYEADDAAREGGEAASIAAMIRFAVDRYRLDAARVYVTGLSAGGAMASVMLATHPEMFAGGAIIAGLPYGVAANLREALAAMLRPLAVSDAALGDRVRSASSHPGPWPAVSVWHGDRDTVVRPSAGDAVARQWRDVHQTQAAPRRARTPDGRHFEVWLSKADQPSVEVHRIAGMAHGTPLKTTGANSCGSVAPHLFDIGISSSFEIALGWGLSTIGHSASLGINPAVDRPRSGYQSPRLGPSPIPTGSGIQGVIENALRSAGLMR